MTIEPIAALGRTWGGRELHDLLAAFRIEGKSVIERLRNWTTRVR